MRMHSYKALKTVACTLAVLASGFYPPYFSHKKNNAGVAICKFKVSGFRSHLLPAIFSFTKQLVLLLDIAVQCVLPYYFNVLCYYEHTGL